MLLGEKITKKRVSSCPEVSKPRDSLLPHDPDVCQNVSVSKDINGAVKTSDKVAKFRTRFVINSSYKPCDVEAMMAMKKDTVCKWFHNSVRKHACVQSSRLSFAQDGGGQKQNAPQISFYDGRLYSEVAAGKASRKATTVPVVANLDHSKSVVLCSNMKRVICSKTSQPDIVGRKNVGNVDKVGSEKMKLYDINGLEISILTPFSSGRVMTEKMLKIVMQNRTNVEKSDRF